MEQKLKKICRKLTNTELGGGTRSVVAVYGGRDEASPSMNTNCQ